MPALAEDTKAEIQRAYSAWLAARGFRARRGQREMVAHIARTLSDDTVRITAVEAGTGTGKTAAYCIAAIPVARALGKTIVISTATVALQEQVVLRDLPDLKTSSGMEFDFALAKGRGRYVCLKRLDDSLKNTGQRELALVDTPAPEAGAVYEAMLNRFGMGEWNGELDAWADGVEPEVWQAVTTDHRGCTNRRCAYLAQCPFFKARGALEGTEVIVANHDLVLADLSLGGGVVLPEPEDCIYIIDEAHHLPDKTQNHFSVRARLRGTLSWLDQINATIGTLTQRFERPADLVSIAANLVETGAEVAEALSEMGEALDGLTFEARDEDLFTHRFRLGCVGQDIRQRAHAAQQPMVRVELALDRVIELLEAVSSGDLNWPNAHEADDWLGPVGQQQSRAGAVVALLQDYMNAPGSEAEEIPPGSLHARWANRYGDDVELVSAPIQTGALLQEALWSRCFAAVCTSATLTAVGSWQRFTEQAGFHEAVRCIRIPSPFDYPRIAELHVPDMRSDPRDFDAHSQEVAALLPDLLAQERSALVLFTSWRQMRRVGSLLPEALSERLLVQGDGSKQALLDAHRARIDAGERSYLIGLASFAEGVDLPDDYCRHVIIVKIPFAVPDDPIDQAMAEWAEHRGRNAFYEISVPDAALKLVQACGRLIRHEGDHGRITMLDRRIVTQRYGELLLRSLPPYRRSVRAPVSQHVAE